MPSLRALTVTLDSALVAAGIVVALNLRFFEILL